MFLHAFPLHAGMWAPQAALSAQARVLTVDAPGRGRSHAVPPSASLEARVDQIAALLDAEQIPKVVLAGLSMGGYTALAFCRRHAERLLGLLLADTRAEADTDEGRAGRMAMIQTAEREGIDAIANAMLPKLLGETTRRTRPDLVEQVRALIRDVPVPAIVSDLLCMAARPDSTALLPTIAVPTLVIVGEEDVPTPPAVARAMADTIPGASLAIIPHAGHLSNLEQQERFNQVVSDFLYGLAEAS